MLVAINRCRLRVDLKNDELCKFNTQRVISKSTVAPPGQKNKFYTAF